MMLIVGCQDVLSAAVAGICRVGAALGGVLLVCCALLVLAVYQLINMSLELCPAAVTYSGLLAHSLGPGWYVQTDTVCRISLRS